MSKFRIAFIGAGDRANQVHYPAFASLPDVEIVGICDIDQKRLKNTAEKYGIPEERRYGDSVNAYRQMIEEQKPDGVACIGQPHLMYDIWMWCLNKGLDLYVEKPLGLNRHQAQMLAEAARRNGCITMCTLQRRTTPCVMQMREECLKRGPITHALVRFYKCDIHDRFDARDHMYDDTIHAIDAVRWACGDSDVVRVESSCDRIGTFDINFISATLHFANGSRGFLINSWSSGRRIFDIEMHAPGICAEVEHEVGGYLYADGDTKGKWYGSGECAGSEDFFIRTGVQYLARNFVDSCRTHTSTCSDFANAVKDIEIAETILAQALAEGK